MTVTLSRPASVSAIISAYPGAEVSCLGSEVTWHGPGSCPSVADLEAAHTTYNARKLILDELHRLEDTITPRRLREATLTAAGKAWLQAIEDSINAQRLLL